MTGARVGGWVLGAEVGAGPLGAVFRAVDRDDPTRVAAVKLLTHPAARSPEFLAKFPAEMLALHRLNHPNIARFYDSGVANGTAYYAAEWVDGTDLGAALRARPRKPDDSPFGWNVDLVRVAVQLARGLKHGHHRSLLHRDLKPSNVLVTPDGTVKLTDYGVEKVVALPPLGLAPDPWGTVGFLAPEFFTGKPLTRRSDLYALGGVLYAVLAGRPPFAAGTTAEFMHKHCYALPDHPVRFAPKLPAELDELICGLLEKHPSRRPASAAAVLGCLDQVRAKLERRGVPVRWPAEDPLDGTGLEAALTEGTASADATARPRPLSRRPWVVLPLFLLVVGAMLAGVFWPGPDPDALYREAERLAASDDPADWDRAWDDYLEPLSASHPDRYAAEVKAAKARILDRKDLRRAVTAGARARYASEAERWYQLGLAEARAGDAAAARRTWEAVTRGFAGLPSEERWVKLSAEALAEFGKNPPVVGTRPTLTAAVRHAAGLRATDPAASDAAFAALEALYRDDPSALETIRRAR